MNDYPSWGKYPSVSQNPVSVSNRFQSLPMTAGKVLPYGLGRSYGDSCLNPEGTILLTSGLDRFIAFEPNSGVLSCEAGVSLADILDIFVPKGWFLPVTPGTKFVTVGGAVANDIHGKNHHRDGTFGHHVLDFELLRSSGEIFHCSREENRELFHATIGGLGLTGLIRSARFKLKKIESPMIAQEVEKFRGLEEFFELSLAAEKDFLYTVSWIDCVGKGSRFARGLFIRGNHAEGAKAEQNQDPSLSHSKSVPFDFPTWVLNSKSIRAFNTLYYHKQLRKQTAAIVPYNPFFYPLDNIHHWNRIYGKNGLLQWQCVVPFSDGPDAIREILKEIVESGMASFLAVLKTFGSIPSIGMLSFPREGVTLALDFPNKGKELFLLLDRLDRIVEISGGAIYAAKDARMKGDSFRKFYPAWEPFQAFIDPQFSSGFWRRIMELS